VNVCWWKVEAQRRKWKESCFSEGRKTKKEEHSLFSEEPLTLRRKEAMYSPLACLSCPPGRKSVKRKGRGCLLSFASHASFSSPLSASSLLSFLELSKKEENAHSHYGLHTADGVYCSLLCLLASWKEGVCRRKAACLSGE